MSVQKKGFFAAAREMSVQKKGFFAAMMHLVAFCLRLIPGGHGIGILMDLGAGEVARKLLKCPHCGQSVSYKDGVVEGADCPHCGKSMKG